MLSNPKNTPGLDEAADFDWAGVEDPLDEIREDFAGFRVPLTAAQAQAVAEWSRRRHSGDEFALTERAVGWIASGRDFKTRAAGSAASRLRETEGQIAARRLGLRAAIVIYELTPHMRNAMPMDRIATVFSVTCGDGTAPRGCPRSQDAPQSRLIRWEGEGSGLVTGAPSAAHRGTPADTPPPPSQGLETNLPPSPQTQGQMPVDFIS